MDRSIVDRVADALVARDSQALAIASLGALTEQEFSDPQRVARFHPSYCRHKLMSLRAFIRRAANSVGYEIRQLPHVGKKRGAGEDLGYATIVPWATYSPWDLDADFYKIFTDIHGFTLVDKYRCFELWKLVEQSAKLSEGNLLEIGVWRGGTGALIGRAARRCQIEGTVFLCDTFSGVVKAGSRDSRYTGGEHSDTSQEIVEGLLERLKLDNCSILKGIFPDDTGEEIASLKFRFCHIDVDVYDSAKDIMDWVWDRLAPGGIIVFDDYGFQTCDGIRRLVEEQMPVSDRLVLHNLNGHAVVIKR